MRRGFISSFVFQTVEITNSLLQEELQVVMTIGIVGHTLEDITKMGNKIMLNSVLTMQTNNQLTAGVDVYLDNGLAE